jgi:malonyl-CoA O-methyltransferase
MTALPASEAYRRWAPCYEQENPVTVLECELVERLSLSPRGLRLLDVGCGTGRRLAATGAAAAVGVEPCAEMLQVGRQTHAFGPEVRLIEGDARALPLADGGFELVWCRLVIGHLAECHAAYGEIGRVAAPGGQVVITDFHPAAYAAGMRRTFRDGGDVVEVEHYVHDVGTQIAAAHAAGLILVDRAEAVPGTTVRPLFEAAGRADLYEKHRGTPLVSALLFVRDG